MNIRNTLIKIISTLLVVSMYSGNGNLVLANDPNCVGAPDGQVYIYNSWDFKGDLFVYDISNGTFTLPDSFRNNVQSFTSGADVCFIKWHPREQYQISSGESHRNYAALTNFGQRMDSIVPGNCSELICPNK